MPRLLFFLPQPQSPPWAASSQITSRQGPAGRGHNKATLPELANWKPLATHCASDPPSFMTRPCSLPSLNASRATIHPSDRPCLWPPLPPQHARAAPISHQVGHSLSLISGTRLVLHPHDDAPHPTPPPDPFEPWSHSSCLCACFNRRPLKIIIQRGSQQDNSMFRGLVSIRLFWASIYLPGLSPTI